MTLKSIVITTAIAAVAVLEMSGSASAACGCKQTWERTKPHVNVGMIGHVKRRKASGHTIGNNTGTQAKGINGAIDFLGPDLKKVLAP